VSELSNLKTKALKSYKSRPDALILTMHISVFNLCCLLYMSVGCFRNFAYKKYFFKNSVYSVYVVYRIALNSAELRGIPYYGSCRIPRNLRNSATFGVPKFRII
jgi:hypothetical protein